MWGALGAGMARAQARESAIAADCAPASLTHASVGPQADGVDTSFVLRAVGAPSPFTYIIVDRQGEGRSYAPCAGCVCACLLPLHSL